MHPGTPRPLSPGDSKTACGQPSRCPWVAKTLESAPILGANTVHVVDMEDPMDPGHRGLVLNISCPRPPFASPHLLFLRPAVGLWSRWAPSDAFPSYWATDPGEGVVATWPFSLPRPSPHLITPKPGWPAEPASMNHVPNKMTQPHATRREDTQSRLPCLPLRLPKKCQLVTTQKEQGTDGFT